MKEKTFYESPDFQLIFLVDSNVVTDSNCIGLDLPEDCIKDKPKMLCIPDIFT